MSRPRSAPGAVTVVVRLVGVALLLAGALQVLRAPGAGADTAAPDGGFRLVARADVASVAVVYPDAPAVPEGQVAYFSPGTAQAVLDSLGTSEATASAPYPGDAVSHLPPTLNGLLGGQASLPDYPFIVTSSHPTRPAAEQEIGPYRIEAKSDGQGSSSAAHLGVSAGDAVLGRVEPSSQVGHHDGTGIAVARTDITGVTVGSVLEIGAVHAEAQIRSVADGAPERSSSLRIEGMKVAGVAVTLTEKGLRVGDTVATAPGTPAIDETLRQAGITVRYLPEVISDTSVTSAALAITSRTAVPGHSPVTVTVTLGAVNVAATTLPAGSVGIGTGDLPALLPEPEPAAPPAGDDITSDTAPAVPADLPAPAALPAGGDGFTVPSPPANLPAEQAVPAPAARPPVTRILAGQTADGRGFYLAMVGAGAALLAGSRLLGALAVQLRRPPRPAQRT